MNHPCQTGGHTGESREPQTELLPAGEAAGAMNWNTSKMTLMNCFRLSVESPDSGKYPGDIVLRGPSCLHESHLQMPPQSSHGKELGKNRRGLAEVREELLSEARREYPP